MKYKKGLVHLFPLVAILVVGISGLLLYSWQRGLIKIGTSQDVSPTPTVDLSETENWKTYINTNQKISFEYPDNWYLTEIGRSSPLSIVLTPNPYRTEILLDAPPQGGIYINYSWSYDNEMNPVRKFKTVSDAVEEHLLFLDPETLTRNDFEIMGNTAVTIKGTTKTDNLWTDNKPVHTTFIQHGDEVLVISLIDNYQDCYDHILSTFEFVE